MGPLAALLVILSAVLSWLAWEVHKVRIQVEAFTSSAVGRVLLTG